MSKIGFQCQKCKKYSVHLSGERYEFFKCNSIGGERALSLHECENCKAKYVKYSEEDPVCDDSTQYAFEVDEKTFNDICKTMEKKDEEKMESYAGKFNIEWINLFKPKWETKL